MGLVCKHCGEPLYYSAPDTVDLTLTGSARCWEREGCKLHERMKTVREYTMGFEPKDFDEWYEGAGLGPFTRGREIYRNCWDCAWLAGFKSRDAHVATIERHAADTERTLNARRYEHERDINRLGANALLLAAVRKLVIAARTSGGTAGRDEGLCEALDMVEALLPPYPSPSQVRE